MDWVLRIFGTQVTRKKRPVRSVFPDYLSVSYDYGSTSFQDVKITNDLPQLLHVEPKNEALTLKVLYHIICNLENGKSQYEIRY